MFSSRKKRKSLLLDDVFMDSINRAEFDIARLEGTIERPINYHVLYAVIAMFIAGALLIATRTIQLQAMEGAKLYAQSEGNRLREVPALSTRGIIYDRNGAKLAWNRENSDDPDIPQRQYVNQSGFSHVLGYVSLPKKDNSNVFWRDTVQGITGIEKSANQYLEGVNGTRLVETNAKSEIISQGVTLAATPGQNVYLTIDADLQSALHSAITKHAQEYGFKGGAGVIMNSQNGEILAMTSYPEYDTNIFQQDGPTAAAGEDPNNPFLNRVISGLYTPGSIIKPFVALGALNESIIDQATIINSSGKVEIPNPYQPDKPAVFRDWREFGHGDTDVKKAIADSVNTFFYVLAGGLREFPSLGIAGIHRYLSAFGVGQATGIQLFNEKPGNIPSRQWKEDTFEDGTWRVGDTLNSVLGQYGFQVTPLQMVRAIAGLANKGTLVTPKLIQNNQSEFTNIPLSINNDYYRLVHEAMRQTVTEGTATALNIPDTSVAAKTGTAQVGAGNSQINSWIIGFYPYEEPKYAFALVMEKGPNVEETRGASWAMKEVVSWVQENYPESIAPIDSNYYFESSEPLAEPL